MELAAYLDRIGHAGPVRPDLATLRAVHRAHLLAIPYENLDVQLGRPLTTDPAAAYAKIVEGRRGGWCYEMNGLLGWALGEIGFNVTRMAGGAVRVLRGEAAVGNHLVLRVDLDRPWIADAGFGDGPLDPYPLEAASFASAGYDFRLELQEDGWWRLHNHPAGGAPSFDFRSAPADEALLADRCDWLQTSPESGFVQNAVAQRHRPDRLLMLRGRVLRTATPTGTQDRLIGSADEYVAMLAEDFGLDLPEAADLWPKIVARHEVVMAAQG
ncbi:N-hydroxyarylamine O-acetyltransferase [Caulobacter ginsengisoli]|uniref:N-hydroxyarylamine O-acetyltransferase n=1 Tax=Caulobacter ginsengisoli TaxID=400775 RepID=A0ABU0IME9_9CAUL|nr:arylamine N-acetyltransferase [Caulobacter ginsengisoli]MDQ0462556.1 N-hydroxyarylamine O-acetyltransferase [Caulobacter ginsengisoli]